MDWLKVISSLENAAAEHQDRANLFATQPERDRQQKSLMYDVSADTLRALARALKRGLPEPQ